MSLYGIGNLSRHLLPNELHADRNPKKLKTAAQRRLTAALYDHVLGHMQLQMKCGLSS
jgi:hypothetical protein